MKKDFEKIIFKRLELIATHFETPKRLNSFEWEGTCLLRSTLTKKGLLVSKGNSLYQWKRNPYGITALPVSMKLASTLVDSIREIQRETKLNKKMKVIIKTKLSLWQRIVNWWNN